MADRAVPGQRVEPLVREDVVHQAHALLEPEPLAVARRDARRLLAAVLQGVETEVGEVRGLGVAEDAEDAALVVEVIVLEGQAAQRRRPGLRSANAPDVSIPLEAFMTPDVSFPDLRGFLDQLRRDRDSPSWKRWSIPPRGGRDPPPGDRRRRPGAAVHATSAARRSRWSPTCSARRAARGSRSASGRCGSSSGSSTWPRRCCRRRPRKLWGARDVGLRGAAHGPRRTRAAGRSPRS